MLDVRQPTVSGLAGGIPSEGFARENVSPGIPLMSFPPNVHVDYVPHECARGGRPRDDRSSGGPTLWVRATTHDRVKGAAEWLSFKRGFSDAVDTTERIGDESVVYLRDDTPHVLFRRGPTTVEIRYTRGETPLSPDLSHGLLPAARAIAERVPRR